MLVAFRKHTKLIFWIILVLIIPAFVLLYIPQAFKRTGGQIKYGTMFDRTITLDEFQKAYNAEYTALGDFLRGLDSMDYLKPQYAFLRVQRELFLAAVERQELDLVERMRMYAMYTGQAPPSAERVSLEDAREILRLRFTDPETDKYDETAYKTRLKELGISDERYVAEFHENEKIRRSMERLPLEYYTWQRLMLAHEAERLNIPVSDQEVLNYLYLAAPGEGGTIDQERYNARLAHLRQSRREYEDDVRTTIRVAKLTQMVFDSARPPAREVADSFTKRYTTYKIAYHLEPHEPLMEPDALREDEVLSFFVNNLGNFEEFQVTPKVAVMYVLVESKGFYPEVEIPEAALTDYYKAHADEFAADDGTVPTFDECAAAVRAAVIAAKPEYLRETERLARAEAARKFLVATPVRLIQEATKRGQELHQTSLFGKEGVIDAVIAEDEEAFREAALGLKAGQVSELVKVKQGWCVLAATQTVPDFEGRQRPFDEVADVARVEAARAQARRLARTISSELYDQVNELIETEQIGFVDACSRLGLDVNETEFLSPDDGAIPGLEKGRNLVYRASVASEWIADGMPAEHARQLAMDEGSAFFNVLETKTPEAGTATESGRQLRDKMLRSHHWNAYQEWLRASFEKANIVPAKQPTAPQPEQQNTGTGAAQQ